MAVDSEHPSSDSSDALTEDFVPVYVANDEMEAKIVREVLKDAGIPVLELPADGGQVYPFPIGPLAEETVAVPESRKEEAELVLRRALENAHEVEDL